MMSVWIFARGFVHDGNVSPLRQKRSDIGLRFGVLSEARR
jgi:hypothetical protein